MAIKNPPRRTGKNNLKGKRYTAEEKARVLKFVDDTNAKQGRGGITAAAAKFGVTALSISNWLKASGVSTGGMGRKSASFAPTLRRLAELHDVISKKEFEMKELQHEFKRLKAKL